MRFHQVQPGELVQPRRKGYLLKCCDCGLVHRMNFRVLKNGRGAFIQFQAFRLKDKVSAKSRRQKVVAVSQGAGTGRSKTRHRDARR